MYSSSEDHSSIPGCRNVPLIPHPMISHGAKFYQELARHPVIYREKYGGTLSLYSRNQAQYGMTRLCVTDDGNQPKNQRWQQRATVERWNLPGRSVSCPVNSPSNITTCCPVRSSAPKTDPVILPSDIHIEACYSYHNVSNGQQLKLTHTKTEHVIDVIATSKGLEDVGFHGLSATDTDKSSEGVSDHEVSATHTSNKSAEGIGDHEVSAKYCMEVRCTQEHDSGMVNETSSVFDFTPKTSSYHSKQQCYYVDTRTIKGPINSPLPDQESGIVDCSKLKYSMFVSPHIQHHNSQSVELSLEQLSQINGSTVSGHLTVEKNPNDKSRNFYYRTTDNHSYSSNAVVMQECDNRRDKKVDKRTSNDNGDVGCFRSSTPNEYREVDYNPKDIDCEPIRSSTPDNGDIDSKPVRSSTPNDNGDVDCDEIRSSTPDNGDIDSEPIRSSTPNDNGDMEGFTSTTPELSSPTSTENDHHLQHDNLDESEILAFCDSESNDSSEQVTISSSDNSLQEHTSGRTEHHCESTPVESSVTEQLCKGSSEEHGENQATHTSILPPKSSAMGYHQTSGTMSSAIIDSQTCGTMSSAITDHQTCGTMSSAKIDSQICCTMLSTITEQEQTSRVQPHCERSNREQPGLLWCPWQPWAKHLANETLDEIESVNCDIKTQCDISIHDQDTNLKSETENLSNAGKTVTELSTTEGAQSRLSTIDEGSYNVNHCLKSANKKTDYPVLSCSTLDSISDDFMHSGDLPDVAAHVTNKSAGSSRKSLPSLNKTANLESQVIISGAEPLQFENRHMSLPSLATFKQSTPSQLRMWTGYHVLNQPLPNSNVYLQNYYNQTALSAVVDYSNQYYAGTGLCQSQLPVHHHIKETEHQQQQLSGKKQGKSLNPVAVYYMNQWFDNHLDHPYPTTAEKKAFARSGSISMSQVSSWFANKRFRLGIKSEKKQSPSGLIRSVTAPAIKQRSLIKKPPEQQHSGWEVNKTGKENPGQSSPCLSKGSGLRNSKVNRHKRGLSDVSNIHSGSSSSPDRYVRSKKQKISSE